MSDQDFYQVLELAYDASNEDVRRAYERLRQLFEEDAVAAYTLFGEDESAQVRERLDEAFAVLSDDQQREKYDQQIGNDEAVRPRDRRKEAMAVESPSLSHTASFDAHSDVTMSVTQSSRPQEQEKQLIGGGSPAPAPALATTPAPATTPASTPAPAAAPSLLASEAAPVTTPEPAKAEAKPAELKPESDNQAGLADTHEDGQYSGGVLQRLRENKSLTIADIAKKTKISLSHLRAIEGNAYDKLPARVYVRGFVSQYARCLGLHPDRTADSYLQIYDRYFQTKT